VNGTLLIAVLLSLLSAVAYALSAVAQERLAARPTSAGSLSVLTSPRWWLTIGLNGGGGVLHVVALAYGSLAVVQPLGMLTLVVALPLGAAIAGRRVSGGEWRGAATTVVGLVGLLLAVDTGAPSESLSDLQILVLTGLTAVVLLALASDRGLPMIVPPGRSRGLRLAAASGIAFAVSSVLAQTVLLRAGAIRHEPVLAGAMVVIIALTVGAMLLSQAAYRYGLGAQLATQSIANPVVSAGLGIVLLGQGVGLTLPSVAVAIVAATTAAAGVALLARQNAGQGDSVIDLDRVLDRAWTT
jgi:drug/metabolite transporter (DMT)-like permease